MKASTPQQKVTVVPNPTAAIAAAAAAAILLVLPSQLRRERAVSLAAEMVWVQDLSAVALDSLTIYMLPPEQRGVHSTHSTVLHGQWLRLWDFTCQFPTRGQLLD